MAHDIQKMDIEKLDSETLEALVCDGNLSKLSAQQRVVYYTTLCKHLGLNPATKPFGYLVLNGKLILYALRNCTDQLCGIHKISTVPVGEGKNVDGVWVVQYKASTPSGRETVSTGAVKIEGLKGDFLANALMKAETKAKRRAVLSLVGLSFLDETEVKTIPDAKIVDVK